MESKSKISSVVALTLLAFLSACSSPPKLEIVEVDKTVPLGIAQVGLGKTSRYVYCDAVACPVPTIKTPIEVAHVVKSGAQLVRSVVEIDVAFDFNSSALSDGDVNKIRTAFLNVEAATVEITARSDFVGPVSGQLKIVKDRAKAMRGIVLTHSREARISELQEIAVPTVCLRTSSCGNVGGRYVLFHH